MDEYIKVDISLLNARYNSGEKMMREAYRDMRHRCEEAERKNEELLRKLDNSYADINDLSKQVTDLSQQVTDLSRQLQNQTAARMEADQRNIFLTNELNESNQLVNTLARMKQRAENDVQQLRSEPRFIDVLDALLPIVKGIFDRCESAESLEGLRAKTLPHYMTMLENELYIRDIELNFHKPGDAISDFDPNVDVGADQPTSDEALHSTVYKSMVWGYSLNGNIVKKEKLCIYRYTAPASPLPNETEEISETEEVNASCEQERPVNAEAEAPAVDRNAEEVTVADDTVNISEDSDNGDACTVATDSEVSVSDATDSEVSVSEVTDSEVSDTEVSDTDATDTEASNDEETVNENTDIEDNATDTYSASNAADVSNAHVTETEAAEDEAEENGCDVSDASVTTTVTTTTTAPESNRENGNVSPQKKPFFMRVK